MAVEKVNEKLLRQYEQGTLVADFVKQQINGNNQLHSQHHAFIFNAVIDELNRQSAAPHNVTFSLPTFVRLPADAAGTVQWQSEAVKKYLKDAIIPAPNTNKAPDLIAVDINKLKQVISRAMKPTRLGDFFHKYDEFEDFAIKSELSAHEKLLFLHRIILALAEKGLLRDKKGRPQQPGKNSLVGEATIKTLINSSDQFDRLILQYLTNYENNFYVASDVDMKILDGVVAAARDELARVQSPSWQISPAEDTREDEGEEKYDTVLEVGYEGDNEDETGNTAQAQASRGSESASSVVPDELEPVTVALQQSSTSSSDEETASDDSITTQASTKYASFYLHHPYPESGKQAAGKWALGITDVLGAMALLGAGVSLILVTQGVYGWDFITNATGLLAANLVNVLAGTALFAGLMQSGLAFGLSAKRAQCLNVHMDFKRTIRLLTGAAGAALIGIGLFMIISTGGAAILPGGILIGLGVNLIKSAIFSHRRRDLYQQEIDGRIKQLGDNNDRTSEENNELNNLQSKSLVKSQSLGSSKFAQRLADKLPFFFRKNSTTFTLAPVGVSPQPTLSSSTV